MSTAELERIRMRASDPPTRLWSNIQTKARLKEARADIAALLQEVERLTAQLHGQVSNNVAQKL